MFKQVSKRGAIELSMTTIIIIIIGITLLGLGLTWISGVFEKISDLSDQAFIQADKEIRDKMQADQNFYVSGQTFDLEAGESKTINVGVRNTLGTDTNIQVTMTPQGEKGKTWEIIASEPLPVSAGDIKGFPISVTVNKAEIPGTTVFFTIKALGPQSQEIGSEVIVIRVI
jgi:uncharacterized membrane protein